MTGIALSVVPNLDLKLTTFQYHKHAIVVNFHNKEEVSLTKVWATTDKAYFLILLED